MALENVMRVDGGHIVTGGGAGGSSVEIDWEDWCELTPEEQETGDWTIINCPWADGNVSIDLMTKLWENPSPSSNFAAQTVLIDLTSFDMVYIQGSDSSCIATKGTHNRLMRVEYADITSTATGTMGIWRVFKLSDNGVKFGDAEAVFTTRALYTSNNYCIPYQIYGIKLTATVKINAIAMDVKASVEYSTSEHLIGKWIDGSDLYEKTIDFGALPNATIKEISSGLSNVTVRDIKGYAKSDNNTICLPFADVPGSSSIYPFYVYADNKLKISSNKNQSAYTECYVTLRYTKNS